MGCGASKSQSDVAPPVEETQLQSEPVLPSTPQSRAKAARQAKRLSEVEELCDELLKIATAIEPKLTESLQDIGQKEDGTLEGLDFRIKGRESLIRKATSDFLEERRKFMETLSGKEMGEPRTMEDVVFNISDSCRYTILFPHDRYTLATKSCLQRLQSEGYLALKVKNFWAPGESYQGINSVFGYDWKDTEGGPDRVARVEIQFHTPASFQTKMASHELYEKYRTESDPLRKAQLYKDMIDFAGTPPLPPDVTSIDIHTSHPPPELYHLFSQKLLAEATKEEPKITTTVQAAVTHALGKVNARYAIKKDKPAVRPLRDFVSLLHAAHKISYKGNASRTAQLDTAAEHIDDSLSYTVVVPEQQYWAKVTETMKSITESGHKQIDFDNYWNAQKGRPHMYKGFHLLFETPTGLRYEVQFHTPSSYDVVDNTMDEDFEKVRFLRGSERTKYNVEVMNHWRNALSPVGEPCKAISEWKAKKATLRSLPRASTRKSRKSLSVLPEVPSVQSVE